MYRSPMICLMAISWCTAGIVPTREESRVEQANKEGKSSQQGFAISEIGNSQYYPQQQQADTLAQGKQLLASQYFYPTYPGYGGNGGNSGNSGYALNAGYDTYLVPTALSPKSDSDWAADFVTSLLPFSSSQVLVYGARAGLYTLHLLFMIILGGAVTTIICTFTPLCTIQFLGFGPTRNQVKEQVAELSRTYVNPESINAATVLVSTAIDKYTAMQRAEDENAKRRTMEKSKT